QYLDFNKVSDKYLLNKKKIGIHISVSILVYIIYIIGSYVYFDIGHLFCINLYFSFCLNYIISYINTVFMPLNIKRPCVFIASKLDCMLNICCKSIIYYC